MERIKYELKETRYNYIMRFPHLTSKIELTYITTLMLNRRNQSLCDLHTTEKDSTRPSRIKQRNSKDEQHHISNYRSSENRTDYGQQSYTEKEIEVEHYNERYDVTFLNAAKLGRRAR